MFLSSYSEILDSLFGATLGLVLEEITDSYVAMAVALFVIFCVGFVLFRMLPYWVVQAYEYLTRQKDKE